MLLVRANSGWLPATTARRLENLERTWADRFHSFYSNSVGGKTLEYYGGRFHCRSLMSANYLWTIDS